MSGLGFCGGKGSQLLVESAKAPTSGFHGIFAIFFTYIFSRCQVLFLFFFKGGFLDCSPFLLSLFLLNSKPKLGTLR